MTDRERLIEILRKPIFPHGVADPTEAVADYLLDNGIVIREKGEWRKNVRGDYCFVCSECGFGAPTRGCVWVDCNRANDERETTAALSDRLFFCPNCGADMREIR